nr:hypothetical protein [Actinokineospora inagensis]
MEEVAEQRRRGRGAAHREQHLAEHGRPGLVDQHHVEPLARHRVVRPRPGECGRHDACPGDDLTFGVPAELGHPLV